MIWRVIKTAMIRVDINSIRELAERTGINPATLSQTRRRDPGSFIWREIKQLDKETEDTGSG